MSGHCGHPYGLTRHSRIPVRHRMRGAASTGCIMIVIGTPLSKHATRILLLGSGELGKEVAIAAQRLVSRWWLWIATPTRRPSGGAPFARHRHDRPKALRALIDQEKPDIIVPEIEAIATEVLVEIESQGRAMVVPSARAVQLTMNREGIRRLAAEELKLPTSAYAFASSYAN